MAFKIPFDIDFSRFKSGLKDMRSGVKEFTNQVEGDLTSGNKGFLKAAGSIGLVTAALGAATAAAGALVKRGLDIGKKISDQAAEAKTSVEGLQVALNLGEDTGAQAEQVIAALKNINTRAVDAKNGAKSYQEALARLNIDFEKFVSLPSERKLEAVAKGFVGAEDDAQAYRDILTLLGEDAGPKLIKVLEQMGTDGFDKLNAKMKESGRIIEEDVIGSIDDAALAYKNLQKFIDTQTAKGAGNLATLLNFGKEGEQSLFFAELLDKLKITSGAVDAFVEEIQKAEDARISGEVAERKTAAQLAKRRAALGGRDDIVNILEKGAPKFTDDFGAGGVKDVDKFLGKSPVFKDDKEARFRGVPVSSLQAIGGGGGVSGISNAMLNKERNMFLKQIAENTANNNDGSGQSNGPALG